MAQIIEGFPQGPGFLIFFHEHEEKVFGGWLPPTMVDGKIRKKDRSILDEITALMECLEEETVVEEPQIFKQQVEAIGHHFDFAAARRLAADKNKAMADVQKELKEIQKQIRCEVRRREDEDITMLLLLA